MSISFDAITTAGFPQDISKCSACGALVLDAERYIHANSHEATDRQFLRLWAAVNAEPDR